MTPSCLILTLRQHYLFIDLVWIVLEGLQLSLVLLAFFTAIGILKKLLTLHAKHYFTLSL
jgi:hypothetical protein